MLEKLREKQTVWETLQHAAKPIVLYGMGDGARKLMTAFQKYGIKLSGVFASDEFVRGHSFAGFPVRSLAQTKEVLGDFIIVLAFGVFRESLLSRIYGLAEQYELYAPDVPVVLDAPVDRWCIEEDSVFDLAYVRKNRDELETVYHMLSDDLSRKTFENVLDFKVSGKPSYLRETASPVSEVYKSIIQPGQHEDYVDLGAYNGDTIQEFLRYTNGEYASILALEPDRYNFKKLGRMIERKGLGNIRAYQMGVHNSEDTLSFSAKGGRSSMLNSGAGSAILKKDSIPVKVNSVDNLLGGKPASIIKFDVEGAEEWALRGAEHTIRKFRPRLMLSAYHRNSDLFLLPLLVKQICPDYQVFLRHHPYIPAWETNFYFTTDKH